MALVILLVAALTAHLFVWPSGARVSSVDAVVVLSGDFGDRMERALELMSAGVAPVLVHAGTPDSLFVLELCDDKPHGYAFEVVCLLPRPDSTRAEARAVGELARERRWQSIAIVTTKFHAARAGTAFRRCVDARVRVVPTSGRSPRDFQLRQIPREWLGVLYQQLANRRC